MSQNSHSRINYLELLVDEVILSRQDPDSGLFPASTSVSQHGDYRDAWVRDNVYTILSVWGMWLYFKKQEDTPHQTEKYGLSVKKLMKGLLHAMMKQSHKVERFKTSRNPLDALHAKYHTQTGDAVVGDDEWGHLQIDATSLFLLMLGQMTQSGLKIIEEQSEVDFIQNLVYYIGNGYQIPDYGIWERGNKINNGRREVHASSVGMIKSALQAIKSTEFFTDQPVKIYVNNDEIGRCRVTLTQLLPRESLSKEVDSAGLSIIGYPAFAIEDQALVATTKAKIQSKLTGNYGCKRFLLDGHQTVYEDSLRHHYNDQELKNFEHIESEWPLFTVYQYINALFDNDETSQQNAKSKIESLMVTIGDKQLLPELYFVDKERVVAEKAQPGSQKRRPNSNVPLIWAQSLYYLARLIDDDFLTTDEVDPIGLHKKIIEPDKTAVNIVFIAENSRVHLELAEKDIQSQIYTDVGSIQILPSTEYAQIHAAIGKNDSMGMTGAPFKRPRSLATAQVYNIHNKPSVFIPGFQNRTSFYFASDYHFLVDKMRAELMYIQRHWTQESVPFMVFLVTEDMLKSSQTSAIYTLADELNTGYCNGVEVNVCHFDQILETATIEQVPSDINYQLPTKFLPKRLNRHFWLDFNKQNAVPMVQSVLSFLEPEQTDVLLMERLQHTDNIYEQLDLLVKLLVSKGEDYATGFAPGVTVKVLMEELYRRACQNNLWNIIRKTASILGKYWGSLEDSVSEILARQKILVVGRSYNDMGLIKQPINNQQVLDLLKKNTGYDEREAIINQEIIVLLSILLKNQPDSFSDVLTLRTGQFAQLIMSQLSPETATGSSESFDQLCNLSPSELLLQVRQVVEHFERSTAKQFSDEALLVRKGKPLQQLDYSATAFELGDAQNWFLWRDIHGLLPRMNDAFYHGLWQLLQRSKGIVVGNRFDSRTRMDSNDVLHSVTPGETQFAHLFEVMVSRIDTASYRQMTIEAVQALIKYIVLKPEIEFEGFLIIEVILGHAVRLNWLDKNDTAPDDYHLKKGAAWHQFYLEPPGHVLEMIHRAIDFLIETGLTEHDKSEDGHTITPHS